MGFNLFDYDKEDDASCEWCSKAGTPANPVYEHDSGIGFPVPMHSICWRDYTENLDEEKEHDWKKDKKKEFADKKASQQRAFRIFADDEESSEDPEGDELDSMPSADDNSSSNATTASRDFYIDDDEIPWVSRDLPIYKDSSLDFLE